jgi:hypothetical protein
MMQRFLVFVGVCAAYFLGLSTLGWPVQAIFAGFGIAGVSRFLADVFFPYKRPGQLE